MNDKTLIINQSLINKFKSSKGGFSNKSLEVFNVKYPLINGWMKELIGQEISEKRVLHYYNKLNKYNENKSINNNIKHKDSLENKLDMILNTLSLLNDRIEALENNH